MTKTTRAPINHTGWHPIARELAAKLIPHTTSVHNVDLIVEALRKEWQEGYDFALEEI